MYRIRNYILIVILIIPFILLSQTKKETAYLLFNTNSNEKCKIAVEGKGYLNLKNIEELIKRNLICFIYAI